MGRKKRKGNLTGKMVLDSFLTLEFFLPREIFLKGNNCAKKVFETIRKRVVILDRRASSFYAKLVMFHMGLASPGYCRTWTWFERQNSVCK